jgi:uncharacterized membrane protein
MPFERYRNSWHNIQSSLWFLPAVLGLVAIILSYVLPQIDTHLPRQIAVHRDWLFYGSPSAARTLLSTLAGSLVTVIAVLFSITMLTLQQASSQFTSRVFQNFTNDRGNQWVLGTYIATFVYCILVLRRVRSESAQTGNFVPVLSITLAVLLAVICIALLVYYIHHSATLFQAATVIERVHHDLLGSIDQYYPQTEDRTLPPANDDLDDFKRIFTAREGERICSNESGYLRNVDVGAILKAIPKGTWGIVHLALGQYVVTDTVLLEAGTEIDAERVKKIRRAFVLDKERTLPEDTLFGIRQLVDIGVKALSPGINDPTTAEHVISALSDALVRLGGRQFPSRIHHRSTEDGEQQVALWVHRPEFDDFVESSFAQIRRAARDDVDVTLHLLQMLDGIAKRLTERRSQPISELVGHIVSQVNQSGFIPEDRTMLLAAAHTVEQSVRAVPFATER